MSASIKKLNASIPILICPDPRGSGYRTAVAVSSFLERAIFDWHSSDRIAWVRLGTRGLVSCCLPRASVDANIAEFEV
eukprot:5795802-Pyramimonas_sp.AAC.1